jgi:hypothetical protein
MEGEEMETYITSVLLVLDSVESEDIRKNDLKSIKVLVNKEDNSLLKVKFDEKTDIKSLMRNKIESVIGSSKFHLEQVYTFGDSKFYQDGRIDIIYLAITNIENIKKLDEQYELLDFGIKNNSNIIFSDSNYKYETKQKIADDNIEYYHEIEVDEITLEKTLLELITAYKYLRARVDNTDIIFKFMPEIFTLEDVRIVYELIKEIQVDKSNFRKRIVKYCEKVEQKVGNKGYRPSQMYRFKPLVNNIWL